MTSDILSFELRPPEDERIVTELEVYCDKIGLEGLIAQLKLLADGETDHVHLMPQSWGGQHLSEQPQRQGNTPLHYVTIMLC